MRRYLRKWGLRRASDTSEKKHLTSSTLPAGSPGRDRTKSAHPSLARTSTKQPRSLENFGTLSAPGMDSLQDEPRDTRSQETSSREHKQVSQQYVIDVQLIRSSLIGIVWSSILLKSASTWGICFKIRMLPTSTVSNGRQRLQNLSRQLATI